MPVSATRPEWIVETRCRFGGVRLMWNPVSHDAGWIRILLDPQQTLDLAKLGMLPEQNGTS